jgi:hypothetical protein
MPRIINLESTDKLLIKTCKRCENSLKQLEGMRRGLFKLKINIPYVSLQFTVAVLIFFFLIYESKCGNLETYFLELLGSLCAFCIKKVRPKSEEKIRGESEEPLVGVLA